jgi:protein ImuB
MPRALETLALFPGGLSSRQSELHAHGHGQNKLWVAAYFPKLALESLAATSADGPTIVTEIRNGYTCVIAANDKAKALGVKSNLKLSAAFALSDSLEVIERCPESERAKLETLAKQAKQLTSVVSLEPPSALLLEVSGSLKLFGGIEAVKNALAALLRQEQVTAFLCAAPTALAALWLARCGQKDVLSNEKLAGRLSKVPIGAAQWPEKIQALLKGMGIRTIGDCMRLPRDGFARRIGRRYLQEIDKSRGSHDPRSGFEPALELTAHLEFTDEIIGTALLTNLGKKLIQRLIEDLRKHQVCIPGFECVFHHLNRTMTVERIQFAESTQDEDRFISLFVDRLEQIRLIAPVIALSLKAGPAEPAIASDGVLFGNPDGVDSGPVGGGLIERLQARFGMESLYSMDLVDEHRPEAAWEKSRQFLGNKRRPPLVAGLTPQRPLWLLPVPRRLPSTVDNLPCYKTREPLRIKHGPERIESGWWDGREIGRDYYIASSAHGERLWIFQDHCPSRDWYLHGFFG